MTHVWKGSFSQTHFILNLEKWQKLVPEELWSFMKLFPPQTSAKLWSSIKSKQAQGWRKGWGGIRPQCGMYDHWVGTLFEEEIGRERGSMCQSLSKELLWKFSYLIFTEASSGRHWYPHVTYEEIEAQRFSSSWPSSHWQQETKLRQESQFGWIQAFLLAHTAAYCQQRLWGGRFRRGCFL